MIYVFFQKFLKVLQASFFLSIFDKASANLYKFSGALILDGYF